MPPDADSPQQSILTNVHATTISVGDITQTIVYQQRPKPLSTTIDGALPPIAHWQTRTEEDVIAGYFANPQVRLVGISAAGGYGKSALAARLSGQATGFAKTLWANFQEPANFGTFGRWLIQQLLGEERYAQVRENYERDTDAELMIKALNLLSQGRYLLVLDNLETLFQSTALWQPYGEFVARWLGRGGGGVVLLTSQIKLELPTAAWKWETLKGLSIEQGVALLEAQQIQGDAADLQAFVMAADGHPLLLQLTASWLRREQAANAEPATIYRLKQDDVTLLREIRERHRDVETSVGELLDRAFEQLYPTHLQVLLWRLSVLRQRFGLTAAQAMSDEPVALADLRKLVRSSFLQEQRVGEDWWFEFLPLIQRYLQQGASQERSIAHEKAIAFFWNHRKLQKKLLEDCREELEAFHHHCELGHYAEADQAMKTCVDFLNRAGYYNSLVPVYERLTQEWQAKDNSEVENLGWAWTQLGITYRSLGRFQTAIASHQQAQQKFQSIATYRNGEAASFNNLGNVYHLLGQHQQAIDFHQQSLEITREIGDRSGEANSLSGLGNAYKSLRQHPQAIDFHQQSLEIAREIGDRNGEGGSLCNLGVVYQTLGQYSRAIELYQQALELQRSVKNRDFESNTLIGLGGVYQALGQYSRAIEFYQQSLKIKREISDRIGEANSLSGLGNAYQVLGQYQQAIASYQQSLEINREIGDLSGKASSLGSLGNTYQALGQYQQAIDFQQQSLEIAREIGDSNGEGGSLCNLGNVYQALGQYPKAIELYQQALELQRSVGNRDFESNTLTGLGNVYRALGQYSRAIEFYQQSLKINREIGDRSGEANSLIGLGNAYQALGQYQQAIASYQQSLEINREIGDRTGEANSLWNLCNLYQQQGKIRKAREFRLAAVKIWQSLKLPIDATPIPEISKRMFRYLEQQGGDWTDSMIQSSEQLSWLTDIIAGAGFLIFLPVRLFQRFKASFIFWFTVGLAIALLIWWLLR